MMKRIRMSQVMMKKRKYQKLLIIRKVMEEMLKGCSEHSFKSIVKHLRRF